MKHSQNGKKNLRRISIVVTAQTLWHLHRLCAMAGYKSDDVGKIIDKIVIGYCNEQQIQEEQGTWNG